jgi:hypothetical protein
MELQTGQSHHIMKATKSSINVAKLKKLKDLATTVTSQNITDGEIKSRINLGNACYYLVQNLLPSSLINKKPKSYLLFCMEVKLGLSL